MVEMAGGRGQQKGGEHLARAMSPLRICTVTGPWCTCASGTTIALSTTWIVRWPEIRGISREFSFVFLDICLLVFVAVLLLSLSLSFVWLYVDKRFSFVVSTFDLAIFLGWQLRIRWLHTGIVQRRTGSESTRLGSMGVRGRLP